MRPPVSWTAEPGEPGKQRLKDLDRDIKVRETHEMDSKLLLHGYICLVFYFVQLFFTVAIKLLRGSPV